VAGRASARGGVRVVRIVQALGLWLTPVVLATLAARAVGGEASAPVLATTLVGAASIGLLVAATPGGTALRTGETASALRAIPVLGSLLLVIAANLLVLGDLAAIIGLARTHGVVGGAALTLGVVAWTSGDRWWRLATPVGVALVVVSLGVVVAAAGSPWMVWSTVASRTALTFREGSPWVTHGGAPAERVVITFHEPHRLAAATPATWRVTERDAAGVTIREWRLDVGDALTVRPGDQLTVDSGARVRFEAGRRVPGAPSSGIAWADGRPRPVTETLARAAGAVLTLVGGGVVLAPGLPTTGAAVIAAPALLLAFVLAGTLWGVYAVALAPDVVLLPQALTPLLETIARAVPSAAAGVVTGLVVIGVVVLSLGVVLTWRTQVTAGLCDAAVAIGRPAPSALARAAITAGLVALAAALALRGGDPWRLFTWGLGLAAAAILAPRLARCGNRGELIGTVVGVLIFAVAVFDGGHLPRWVADSPALVAGPLAWMTARLTRRRG
jgi:hypothetical protein